LAFKHSAHGLVSLFEPVEDLTLLMKATKGEAKVLI